MFLDADGDRKADLVSVNSNDDNDVAVALGDGQGRFIRAAGSPFAVGPGPYPLALGDLDADGKVDMVVTSTGFRNGLGPVAVSGLTALFGDGRGGFRRSEIPLRTGHTWFVAIGDVNADGNTEVVIAGYHEVSTFSGVTGVRSLFARHVAPPTVREALSFRLPKPDGNPDAADLRGAATRDRSRCRAASRIRRVVASLGGAPPGS